MKNTADEFLFARTRSYFLSTRFHESFRRCAERPPLVPTTGNPRARRTTESPDYDVRLFLFLYSTILLSSPMHTSLPATPYLPHRERNEKRKPHCKLLTLNRCAPRGSRNGVLVDVAGVHPPPPSLSLSLPLSLSLSLSFSLSLSLSN